MSICGRLLEVRKSEQRRSVSRTVRGKTEGKAWIGGLACSGLAGYQAS